MDSRSGIYSGITRVPISAVAQFGYSVGHILNDLCSSCWFTYLIIYLTEVLRKSKDFAGVLMLVGQVADGLATPLVGIAIDKIGIKIYGKRKTWHLIGTACVAVAFSFIFHKCFGCEDSSEIVQQVYYGAFIVMFQFGWASTQISHLSLIPVLTICRKKIVFLNSVRSGLTFVCGIAVYILMWFLLHKYGSNMEPLGPGDSRAFSYLSLIVIGTGLAFSLLFHVMVRESSDEELSAQVDEQADLLGPKITQRTIRCWLTNKKFYLVGLMYMFTRLAVNVPQVYLPLYLTSSLNLKKESIAYYPLMMLICSVIGSFLTRPLSKYVGKRITYVLGAVLVIGSSFWFQFQSKSNACPTYGATALIGAGSSIMLIMSLSMTADLIGVHTSTGAFVYGSMSLLDKISNGIVIALIQHFHPDHCTPVDCPTARYYRYTMSTIPGGAALLGAVATLVLAIEAARARAQLADSTSPGQIQQAGTSDDVISNPVQEINSDSQEQ
ncbi:hypothetical protein ACHWQZ_G009182 [Mnemiopsis leidyi]